MVFVHLTNSLLAKNKFTGHTIRLHKSTTYVHVYEDHMCHVLLYNSLVLYLNVTTM